MGKIYKKFGRLVCGKPLNLYYDEGYKEDNADIETCLPIRKGKKEDGIEVKQLTGGPAITLIHKGPYDQLGRSYEAIINWSKEKGLNLKGPSREVYLKGPGMILRGNPKNYLTEIQFLLA
jgi:effector-binding domain-containing protein